MNGFSLNIAGIAFGGVWREPDNFVVFRDVSWSYRGGGDESMDAEKVVI
ncbi:hypothetical protein [Fontibacillus panacisegetis]|nr:hypothetical protein [Fontibacillus panacisegetis]